MTDSTIDDDFEAEFVFTWEIENLSHCLPWLWVRSPTFTVESMNATKWCLHLWTKEYTNGIPMEYYLYRESNDNGPEAIEVEFELSFLDADGSPLTRKMTASSFEKDDFKARCKLRRPGAQICRTVNCSAGSSIGVESSTFEWVVENFSSFQIGDRRMMLVQNTRKDKPSAALTLSLTGEPGEEKLQIEVTHDHMNKPNMTSCEIAVVDTLGNVLISKKDSKYLEGTVWEFPYLLKKKNLLNADSKYMQNDCLILRCDLTISIGVISNEMYGYSSEETDNNLSYLSVISNDEGYSVVESCSLRAFLEILYEDRTFSDINLKIGTETFPVHRVVLGLRSPVFKTMFAKDLTQKDIEIYDLEADTLLKLLGYIYTNTIDELNWEVALKLYHAAKEYQILSLKQRCSMFLKENVDPSRACSVLLLAYENHDEELTEFTQEFISGHDTKIIHSDEWEELKRKNFQLAFETLQFLYLRKIEQKT
ncbi:speckle-type POZ protein B [Trichonephila clavata]|uniref:Speckle-type POZ protein B n=1 Tax=Trichonephila clavata TaxID=2740835 RepID=A0A8X6GXI9_TRICU|nr:speckle-type POZ protein B [Trichonephila clavata]